MRGIDNIFDLAVSKGASDIHLTLGKKPTLRVNGELSELEEYQENTREQLDLYVREILKEGEYEKYKSKHSIDTSTTHGNVRLRVHIYNQKECDCIVMRLIPTEIPHFNDVNLPESVRQFTKVKRGLVLVTGITGSGKSTTLATMIREINDNYSKNIITVEEPVEFIHNHSKSIINQREIGVDTDSFSKAVVDAMRADPDILLVGEMRDLDTIKNAITMAETGHLVFGTLHTKSAAETIDRLIDVFPANQQAQIRIQLSNSISGIVSQELLPKIGGGRVPCCEIMVSTAAVRSIIRKNGNPSGVIDDMQKNNKELGTQTKVQALADLYAKGLIAKETAINNLDANDIDTFKKMLMFMR